MRFEDYMHMILFMSPLKEDDVVVRSYAGEDLFCPVGHGRGEDAPAVFYHRREVIK